MIKYEEVLVAKIPTYWIQIIGMMLEKYDISQELIAEVKSIRGEYEICPFEKIRKELNCSKKDIVMMYRCVRATTIWDMRTGLDRYSWLTWKCESPKAKKPID